MPKKKAPLNLFKLEFKPVFVLKDNDLVKALGVRVVLYSTFEDSYHLIKYPNDDTIYRVDTDKVAETETSAVDMWKRHINNDITYFKRQIATYKANVEKLEATLCFIPEALNG